MDHTCFVGEMSKLSLQIDKYISKRIKEENLPILKNHIPLFYILKAVDNKIVFNDLMKQWGISKSSLSDIVNKYVKLGIISKCECADDKRSVYIVGSEQVYEIHARLNAIELEILGHLFDGVSDDHQEIFVNIVRQTLARGSLL